MKKIVFSVFSLCMITDAFAASANTFTPFDLQLRGNASVECEPKDPNAQNQFACCVQKAIGLQVDAQNVAHLKVDKSLCTNPALQDMQFAFVHASTNDSYSVYELRSPDIEQTPFKSYAGNPTKFWISVNSNFDFPKKMYGGLTNNVYSFVAVPSYIEQSLPDGSKKTTFQTELSSILGWKLVSEVVLSERFETYDCGVPHAWNRTCTDRIRQYEMTWLNQLTNDSHKENFEKRETVGNSF